MGACSAFRLSVFAAFVVGAARSDVLAHPGPHEEIERLDALIAAEPQRGDLYIERAFQFRLAGQHEVALADLDSAERLAPQDPAIWIHRGLTLAEMQRDVEAHAALSRYLEASAGNTIALAERGRLRERLGRSAEALADYTAALAIQPEVTLYLLRGALHEKLGDLDAAAAGYREGLVQLGDAITIRQALIGVEIKRKDYAAAIALVNAALESAPNRTPWLMRRAEILELAGHAAEAESSRLEALAEIDRLLARRPTAIHLVSRAEIYRALGRPDDARRDVELALNKAPHYRAAQELQSQLAVHSAKE